eukprot:TRINITY_DN17709_c2_g1_i1.p1 TRINITY_DN17709_c2_g1~~TRINITY_DN17709_c2_g1_i1.p1  ORF type:complete len:112 (-),score=7.87 TRINITY_DN17709_c2_g1_i1:861-1196(-)
MQHIYMRACSKVRQRAKAPLLLFCMLPAEISTMRSLARHNLHSATKGTLTLKAEGLKLTASMYFKIPHGKLKTDSTFQLTGQGGGFEQGVVGNPAKSSMQHFQFFRAIMSS